MGCSSYELPSQIAPGSSGAVATAMGRAQADINAVEIVEKYEGFAIDDFMVELPTGVAADELVTACESEPGVEVIWVSHYPEAWGLQADVDVLTAMTEEPDRAEEILATRAPAVFRVSWAILVDRQSAQGAGPLGDGSRTSMRLGGQPSVPCTNCVQTANCPTAGFPAGARRSSPWPLCDATLPSCSPAAAARSSSSPSWLACAPHRWPSGWPSSPSSAPAGLVYMK